MLKIFILNNFFEKSSVFWGNCKKPFWGRIQPFFRERKRLRCRKFWSYYVFTQFSRDFKLTLWNLNENLKMFNYNVLEILNTPLSMCFRPSFQIYPHFLILCLVPLRRIISTSNFCWIPTMSKRFSAPLARFCQKTNFQPLVLRSRQRAISGGVDDGG